MRFKNKFLTFIISAFLSAGVISLTSLPTQKISSTDATTTNFDRISIYFEAQNPKTETRASIWVKSITFVNNSGYTSISQLVDDPYMFDDSKYAHWVWADGDNYHIDFVNTSDNYHWNLFMPWYVSSMTYQYAFNGTTYGGDISVSANHYYNDYLYGGSFVSQVSHDGNSNPFDTYSLTFAAGTHGSVTAGQGSTSGSRYGRYKRQTLSASADSHYHFVNWTDSSGSEVSTDANYTFYLSSDTNLTANFAIDSNCCIVTLINSFDDDTITQTVEKGDYKIPVHTWSAPSFRTFAGWNTAKSGSEGTQYTEGEVIDLQSDLTLYCRWSYFAMSFSIDGGTTWSQMDDQQHPTDPSVYLRNYYSHTAISQVYDTTIIFKYVDGSGTTVNLNGASSNVSLWTRDGVLGVNNIVKDSSNNLKFKFSQSGYVDIIVTDNGDGSFSFKVWGRGHETPDMFHIIKNGTDLVSTTAESSQWKITGTDFVVGDVVQLYNVNTDVAYNPKYYDSSSTGFSFVSDGHGGYETTCTITGKYTMWIKTTASTGDTLYTFRSSLTATFDVQGKGDNFYQIVTGLDKVITKPEDPTYPGFTFEGWYENAECTGSKYNFQTVIYNDKTLYANWIEDDPLPVTTSFISSSGDIGVMFTFAADQGVTKVSVSRPNPDITEEMVNEDITVSEVSGTKSISVKLNAAQLTKTITLKFFVGDEELKTYSTTGAAIIKERVAAQSGSETNQKFLESVLLYGKYSMEALGMSGDPTSGYAFVTNVPSTLAGVTAETVSAYQLGFNQSERGANMRSISFANGMFDTGKIKFTFKFNSIESGKIAITGISSENYEIRYLSDNKTVEVIVKNIKANQCAVSHTMTVTDSTSTGGGNVGFEFCFYSYCYQVLNGTTATSSVKNLCRAMYVYGTSAAAAFGA